MTRRTLPLVLVALLTVACGGAPAASVTGGAITFASANQVGDDEYRIEYGATPTAGAVEIHVSASPVRIDAPAPVLTTTTSPVTVRVPGRTGRIYFHVKPASGPRRVVSTRRLPLEGAVNFRDLGGYETTDGRFTRWGVVFRTDHLTGLTPRDYEYLETLGLRLVCDLRTPGERTRAPTNWQGPPPEFLLTPILTDEYLNRATGPMAQEEFKRRFALVSAGRPLPVSSVYEQFVLAYAASYQQVFQRLVSGDLPAVTHCTAGQDRTGVYSAMLLTMLGVPWNTVVADYLLTTKYRLTDALVEQRRRDWREQYGVEATPEVVRKLQGLKEETLKATFDAIDKKYGSFDAFRRETLAVSDAELSTLRDRLLEP